MSKRMVKEQAIDQADVDRLIVTDSAQEAVGSITEVAKTPLRLYLRVAHEAALVLRRTRARLIRAGYRFEIRRPNFIFSVVMKQIAQILLFDRNQKLLIYLRDDKPEIPFPNHWDFFGGHVEGGETAEEALVRELREELGVDLQRWEFFRRYECLKGDAYPNRKFIYRGEIDLPAAELTLYEGQRLTSIDPEERFRFKFANILGDILEDFIASGLWPQPVDKY